MDENERPFPDESGEQSILADMLRHCESLNALANNLAVAKFDDNYDKGLLVTEIITLEEQVKKIQEHIEKIRADT